MPSPPSVADQPCAMIVPAAGRGQRFGGPGPKQYQPLFDRPLIVHTLTRLHDHPLIHAIVPVIAPDGKEAWQALAPWLDKLPKVTAPAIGGAERQISVINGLKALDAAPDSWVGVHDAARPFPSRALLDRLFQARAEFDAIICALPTHDTVKQVNAEGVIEATLDRQRIWRAQTPQIFRYKALMSLHQEAHRTGFLGTDDASLAERADMRVKVVEGDDLNLKVTRPEDALQLETLLKAEQQENASQF